MRTEIFELPFSLRVGIVAVVHWVVFEWTRSVVAPARVGWPRFLRALVLLPVLLLAGILFDTQVASEFILSMYFSTTFLWLIPCKICAFCCNRSQLVKSFDYGSVSAFALGLLLPVNVAFEEKRIEPTEQDNKERHAYRDARFSLIQFEQKEMFSQVAALLARIFAKVCVMAIIGWCQSSMQQTGRQFLNHLCLGWFACVFTAIIHETTSLLVLLIFRFKLDESFRRPWISQSITELWSRRYNLIFGTVLRNAVYDPIHEGWWVRGDKYFVKKKPSLHRKAAAVMACFSMSAFMHMFLMVYANSVSNWPILYGLFFVLNGVLILSEEWISRLANGSEGALKKFAVSIPSWMRVLYSHLVIYTLNHYLLWTEIETAGRVDNMLDGARPFSQST